MCVDDGPLKGSPQSADELAHRQVGENLNFRINIRWVMNEGWCGRPARRLGWPGERVMAGSSVAFFPLHAWCAGGDSRNRFWTGTGRKPGIRKRTSWLDDRA